MKVMIFPGTSGSHSDERRLLVEAIPENNFLLPFTIKQIKTILFTKEAVKQGLAVGNHYHPEKSGRWEFFAFMEGLRPSEKNLLPVIAIFRYKKASPKFAVSEYKLRAGDSCLIPPGYSHAFLPIEPGIIMVGISNKRFIDVDDISDKLF